MRLKDSVEPDQLSSSEIKLIRVNTVIKNGIPQGNGLCILGISHAVLCMCITNV